MTTVSNPAAAQPRSGFSSDEKPRWEDYALCIHCGLCLNHCPTYRLWGMEADSPRGRIRQMLLVDRGELELGETFVTHIDRCLDCRACETACPSGVKYGRLVEFARAQIEQQYRRGVLARLLQNGVYRHLLPHPSRIAALARLLRFYQRSGLQRLVRASGVLRLLRLEERERLLPAIDGEFFAAELGQTFPARGERRARVAFFAGCIARVSFAELNRATIRVLTANGCEVVVPRGQNCCGALALHAGFRETARSLARTNLDAFLKDNFDAVLTNAAGCGATLKEYPELLTASDDGHERAEAFRTRMKDVTEFLCELGWQAPLRKLELRVTYQDSCHLLHGQRIREAPRELIRKIPGIEFVELPYAELCCGSAGVYNVTQPAAAMAILKEKMQHAAATKAAAIVTANPGCLLQLRAGVQIHRTGQQVLHVIELLDRALA
jgi:glycolate oxidase iron-sulfur subunit